jgi:Zn-dependent peptidase ImmA (M78 family)
MTETDRKSPKKAANDLSVVLRAALGEDRFPVDVEALAFEVSKNFNDPITKIKGVEIDGFEGMLRANRKKPSWQILYTTATDYPGRERFTLAHEFGHYVLHRHPLQAADYASEVLADGFDFACLPLQTNEWKDVEKEREEEADTFASYLLMPIDDYREQVAGEDMTLDLLSHVRKRYGVSLLAAVRKWIEFTDTRAAMVVARDGFALWGRASTAAYKTGIFIRSGMPIPGRSIAALGPAAQGAEANQAIILPADVWTFSRGSEPVHELAIFSERLGISVSLLQFEKDVHIAEIDDDEPCDMYDQLINGGLS